jgi:hypothetical protein
MVNNGVRTGGPERVCTFEHRLLQHGVEAHACRAATRGRQAECATRLAPAVNRSRSAHWLGSGVALWLHRVRQVTSVMRGD